MITSMTGFGRGEVRKGGHTAVVEVRSVNSRFLEVSVRTPRSLSAREKDIKDLLRKTITRGSLNVSVKIERDKIETGELSINARAARAYYSLLNDLRKAVKIKEEVTLQHLLQFSEVLRSDDSNAS